MINFDTSLASHPSITSSTASRIEILPMNAIAPNASYTMSFHGPSLQCSKPSDKLLGSNNVTTAVAVESIFDATIQAISPNIASHDLSIEMYRIRSYVDGNTRSPALILIKGLTASFMRGSPPTLNPQALEHD